MTRHLPAKRPCSRATPKKAKKATLSLINLLIFFLLVVFHIGSESTPCNFRSGFFPKSQRATVQKQSRCKTLELMISMKLLSITGSQQSQQSPALTQALVPVRWLRSMDKHKSSKRKKAPNPLLSYPPLGKLNTLLGGF